MIISVIVPDQSLQRVIERELVGYESEVIVNNWQDGFEESTGQFVCFMENDCDYRGGIFIRGLLDMLVRPSYRKLAMVSPVIEELAHDRSIYGFKVNGGVIALDSPASLSTHMVQVGYVAGSIIRRSAIADVDWDFSKSTLELSARMSLYLWEHGLRIQLDPQMVYIVDKIDSRLSKALEVSEDLKAMWHQESI